MYLYTIIIILLQRNDAKEKKETLSVPVRLAINHLIFYTDPLVVPVQGAKFKPKTKIFYGVNQ
jgi:hypothetical protein